MDKNSIFGILIIAAILVVWGVIQSPNKKQLEKRRKYEDSLVKEQQKALRLEDSIKTAQLALAEQDKSVDTASTKQLTAELGQFAANATGRNEFYTIENDVIKLVISSKGGRPYSVELKKYKKFNGAPVVLFSGDSTQFGLSFYENKRDIHTNDLYFKPTDSIAAVKEGADSIAMRLTVGTDRYIEYRYALEPGSYMVNFGIGLLGMKDIGTRDPSSLDFSWEVYVPQHEQLKKNENQYTSLYYKHYKEDVEFFKPKQSKQIAEENIPTQIEWVAFKSQFFSSVILAQTAFSNAYLKSTNLPEADKYLKDFRAELGIPFQRLDNENINLNFYFGPNKFKLLKQYHDRKLEDLVSLGRNIIRAINQWLIIPVFDWLSKFIGNFGIIILLLTIIIKVLLLPLTYKSYLSQARMKVLKPMMDEINEKYPKGKEVEKQQATMALYKKAGISPLGGCLPTLLQFPILFAMFRFFPTSIELRQEGFLWAKDLSTYDAFITWHQTIPIISNIFGNHISLFTVLMTVSTILQIKMSDTSSSQQMPGMKTMMYVMPVMFMFMLNNFSAGLTYYYFLANVITIGQNYIFKQFVDEKEILRKIEERKAKTVKKSKWQQRLEEMTKQQQQRKPGAKPQPKTGKKK
jgi:YidC/Oxa1 family membrane protein insertase